MASHTLCRVQIIHGLTDGRNGVGRQSRRDGGIGYIYGKDEDFFLRRTHHVFGRHNVIHTTVYQFWTIVNVIPSAVRVQITFVRRVGDVVADVAQIAAPCFAIVFKFHVGIDESIASTTPGWSLLTKIKAGDLTVFLSKGCEGTHVRTKGDFRCDDHVFRPRY